MRTKWTGKGTHGRRVFNEIPVPRPWDADSEHRTHRNTIEQAVVGEQAGFDSFWTVEHHFLDEYSHCGRSSRSASTSSPPSADAVPLRASAGSTPLLR